jgi:hypothetical protein
MTEYSLGIHSHTPYQTPECGSFLLGVSAIGKQLTIAFGAVNQFLNFANARRMME